MSFFRITHKEKHTNARAGVIHTAHGDIQTPIFMPVGTQATVKALDTRDLLSAGAQIILGNNYHLHLRPGEDRIASFGGLHQFMNWQHPMLTDSGGFQVFSLGLQKEKAAEKDAGKLVSIDEDGVSFRSHIDGSLHRFTPETAIEMQHKIGADIIMAFDECTPDTAPREYVVQAMERTHRWAERSLAAHKKNTAYHGYPQYLFGIIQGANVREFREASARYISALPFDGIAVGGESIGYNMEATKEILEWILPIIPEDKPHYAMGVGFSPLDLFDVIERGIDMFDCVAPTRMARNGSLFVSPQIYTNEKSENTHPKRPTFRISIDNARYATDRGAIDPTCLCFTCTHHSRAYLHHLFKAEELLAYRLATIHNVHFLLSLIKNIREAILTDTFLALKNTWTVS